MISNYKLILASGSPRRQQLLRDAGFVYEVRLKETKEDYPSNLLSTEVPEYLAKLKAKAFQGEISEDELLITADTIVELEGEVIGKPKDRVDAIRILEALSGKCHNVITGVCLTTSKGFESYSVESKVYFNTLQKEEIEWYIDRYRPYDKAGAYGIQEWIGYIGIEKIEGSFYNVMGLPIQTLYQRLKKYGIVIYK